MKDKGFEYRRDLFFELCDLTGAPRPDVLCESLPDDPCDFTDTSGKGEVRLNVEAAGDCDPDWHVAHVFGHWLSDVEDAKSDMVADIIAKLVLAFRDQKEKKMIVDKISDWTFLLFEYYKPHFCPNELITDLIIDIESRGGPLIETKSVDKGGADRPGMVLMDRPWETIILDGFKLEFPSQDFEYFMEELKSSSMREFISGKKYYKVHGWRHCIVVTPKQREIVLQAMDEMLPRVRARCEEAEEKLIEVIERIDKNKVLIIPRPTKILPGRN
jgi:hypothetical protein